MDEDIRLKRLISDPAGLFEPPVCSRSCYLPKMAAMVILKVDRCVQLSLWWTEWKALNILYPTRAWVEPDKPSMLSELTTVMLHNTAMHDCLGS